MNYNNLANKPAAPKVLQVTLSTNWTGTETPFIQAVTVSGVTASSIVNMDVQSGVTAEQFDAFINAKIVDGGQGTNSVTLKAFGDKPEVDIPVKFVVM